MENTSRNRGENGNGEEENATLYAIESLESKGEPFVSKRCRRNGRTLILSIRKSRATANSRDLFLHNNYGSCSNSIPKHLTTCDEKYVLRCLELIRNCAIRAAAWNFSQKTDMLSDHTSSSSAKIESRSLDNVAIEYPLGGQTEVVSGDWTIGSISGSPAMINILKSPLLQRFGSLDGMNKPFNSDFMSPVQEPAYSLSRRPQKDVVDCKYVSAPLHKRDASISSSSSSFSDQSSSSSSHGASFQGMLQFTWKNGLPHHVFTVDDKKEVYVANLSEADSSHDKDLDYVYTFHLRKTGKKDADITTGLELETVAKMRVSTSITFSSSNSEVRETRFVLSVSGDNRIREPPASNQAPKKCKRLTRKVVDVFRQGHFNKQRSSSTLEGSSSVFQDPSVDVHNSFVDLDDSCEDAPNHELAAIVVKDTSNNSKEVETGGWGLKFLKKTASVGPMIPSEHSRNTGECSTSMDIVIPAGFHGGPKTRVGGPSSLIERWASGGLCDCGGWDIGCPLTILKTRSSSTDYSSSLEASGECKSIDLYMQGSKQNGPIMKMVNIHKGLYYIHFQPAVSTLQSFAIAAAIIHSHSPDLRPKLYRS